VVLMRLTGRGRTLENTHDAENASARGTQDAGGIRK
jgi:hypothetical protein